MKNRLSTLLMVLLTAFMVQCKSCKSEDATPVVEGTWNIESVTSSVGGGVTAKYDATGGTLTLTPTTYAIAKAGGVATVGGSGTAALAITDATNGTVTFDPAAVTPAAKAVFTYSDLTATTVTLNGNITNGTGKTTQNNLIIKLKR